MPAVNITTTAAKAFDVPPRKWGFTVRNNSDTTVYTRLSKNVATSGDDMGMPLDPGAEKTFCFAEQNRNSIALIAIHGGSGNKSLVYDFLETQLQAVFGGGESSTLVNSDIQIGAVEVKNGGDDTRAVVGAGSGLSSASNALAVGGQLGGFTLTPSATFTRPADTTAYASGDLVANSTTAGSVTPMTFTVARIAAGSFTIRKARLRKTGTSTTNAGFRLHLYTSSPTVTNGDNGAWLSTQSATYVGAIDFSSSNALAFSDGAGINGVPLIGSDISVKLASGTSLFGLLEARAAYTPANAEQFTITLEAFQD